MAQKKVKRHPGAIKAHRQSVKRYSRNRFMKKGLRLATRAVLESAAAKKAPEAQEKLSLAQSALDKAAQGGALHWKTAARRKSRLAARMAAQLAAPAAAAK